MRFKVLVAILKFSCLSLILSILSSNEGICSLDTFCGKINGRVVSVVKIWVVSVVTH